MIIVGTVIHQSRFPAVNFHPGTFKVQAEINLRAGGFIEQQGKLCFVLITLFISASFPLIIDYRPGQVLGIIPGVIGVAGIARGIKNNRAVSQFDLRLAVSIIPAQASLGSQIEGEMKSTVPNLTVVPPILILPIATVRKIPVVRFAARPVVVQGRIP